ncbi:hypothetical protein Taro_043718 [Colocasia esculenta]|uniref:Putative plant transposon protein domain-containing protein n=1 Tax=Colocasia esculenta TaxID=4460 RepID=A0A843WZE5_COLES|nr:hypothetical protein [Colocasia esculenta]
MGSIIAAMERMKWSKMATLSEVSYLDLVKDFFVCLKTKEDGSLTSTVKGTQIKITYGLLESLFGVCTIGHSGIHTVDIQVKGLGIVGPEFKLKDGKIDINQLNTFNRILHFVVCQILVPRSATFSTCTKADSDMMFWAIQNQSINMAEVMIERMKFASAQVWDKKSKINVSLPYAHLLTKVFQHFGINLSGAVLEKMGQAIRSRNLKKSGFSLVAGVWTKTSVAEGEAIIGEAQEVYQEVGEAAVAAEIPAGPGVQEHAAQEETQVAAAAEVRADELVIIGSQIEDIPQEFIEPVGQNSEVVPPSSQVATILRSVLFSLTSIQVEPEILVNSVAEVVESGHNADVMMEEAPIQGEQEIATEDVQVEDAPSQREQSAEKEAASQGEHTANVPIDE